MYIANHNKPPSLEDIHRQTANMRQISIEVEILTCYWWLGPQLVLTTTNDNQLNQRIFANLFGYILLELRSESYHLQHSGATIHVSLRAPTNWHTFMHQQMSCSCNDIWGNCLDFSVTWDIEESKMILALQSFTKELKCTLTETYIAPVKLMIEIILSFCDGLVSVAMWVSGTV